MNLEPLRFSINQASFTFAAFTVTGADGNKFLEGQSSQALSEKWSLHTFLDRSGRVECYFIAWKDNSKISVLTLPELSKNFSERFVKYVISEDVILHDHGEKDYWIAMGVGELPSGIAGSFNGESAWLSLEKFESVPECSSTSFRDHLDAQGITFFESKSSLGKIINSTRLFDIAVNLKKGCFPGQEVVAKIHYNRGAAWAPVLVEKLISGELPQEIVFEGRVIAKLIKPIGNNFFQAEVLRDFRVDGLSLDGKLRVKLYPLFSATYEEKARELFYLGAELFRKGDENQAASAWKLSICADPNYPDSYEALGVLLGRQEKFSEAEAWMRKLLEVDPSSVMAHTNLSLFLMRQNRIQEAEDHKAKATVAQFAVFGKASKDARDREEKLEAELRERNRREKMFRDVLEIDPEDAMANYGLGSLELERGNLPLAVAHLEKVIQFDRNYSVAYLALGKALKKIGDLPRALEVWRSGVKIAAQKGEIMPANEMQSLINSSE